MERSFGFFVGGLGTVFVWTSDAWRGIWLLVPGVLWFFLVTPATAQVAKAPEYSLKAAYLFNFTQFVEWPANSFASANAPVVIGVLGEDPFGSALDQAVKDKTVHGRSFEIKRFKQIADLRECHVLFVCVSETKRLPEILLAIKTTGVLTVSDIDRFAEQGGMIGFTMESNKIRFEISVKAAEQASVKISAQLLRLAKHVWRSGEAEP